MRLTSRRLELLRSVAELYLARRLPVHYGALAARLGISKWTVYETLKRLEELGLVEHEYAREEGRSGRPPVLFRPSEAAWPLLGLPRDAPRDAGPSAAPAPSDPREPLEELFARWVGAPDPLRQLRELLAGMASCREPLEAAVRTLAAALLLLRLVGLDVDGLIAASRRIVAPQARLAFALGAASALLEGPAQLLREGVRRPMEDALGGLVARLGRLAPGEADRLSRFLDVVRPSVP